MGQAYSVLYSDKAVDGGVALAKPSVAIATGMHRCIKIPFPHHGRITNLTVSQDSDDIEQVSYSLELLKSSFPFAPDEDVALGTEPADELAHYRILPSPGTIPAGEAFELDSNYGYTYRNLDGNFTIASKYVYLLIVPVGASGTTTWEFSVTGEQESLT